MASTKLPAADERRSVPVLDIESLEQPFNSTTILELERLLPRFIAGRRWFRSKTRTIAGAEIEDVVSIGAANSYLLVVQLSYADEGSDTYVLTVAFGDGSHGQPIPESATVFATYRTGSGEQGNIYDALSNASFRSALLTAVEKESSFPGRAGQVIASKTVAFHPSGKESELESSVSSAEQSNSSIIFGRHYILKLFRKVETGVNPDIEIGRFLTERGFEHTPAALGTIEYRPDNSTEIYELGILQRFVPNQGDAWKYTLDSLGEFFARALATNSNAPQLRSTHPLDLLDDNPAPNERELLGSYLDSAQLLGVRTAEMHAALTDENAPADFKPEEFTSESGESLYQEMLGQADITFELLRRKQTELKDEAIHDAKTLLHLENRVMDRFAKVHNSPVTVKRIRFHGDFHLGQVLYTGNDFMIIDFEGEPARPLNERRSKAIAMRDIAGMLRSFQYAAFAALFGQVPGVKAEPDQQAAIESGAAFWSVRASAAYLRGYFSTAGELASVPKSAQERRMLLDAFLLQKALYEVAYELNNRPDWVRIPLRGILSLVN